MTPGYSGTPLPKKLGITKPAMRVHVQGLPVGDYRALLGTALPDGVLVRRAKGSGETDLMHLFATERADLTARLAELRSTLREDVPLWVSWPKKAAKVPTTITEDVIREVALPLGFVDIKVCAVSEVWSGLKLMVRREFRG